MARASSAPVRERDIIHERGDWWVHDGGDGHFRVYRAGIVASTRWGTFHLRDRAISECDQRAEHEERLARLGLAELRGLCKKVRLWDYAAQSRERLVNRLYLFRERLEL